MKHLFKLLLVGLSIFQLQAQDSLFVTVHVIYGSKPISENEGKWFGGKLGGHVGLEIMPGQVIHFNPGGAVKATRQHSDTGSYVQSSIENFYCTFGCELVKTMQVNIPVTLAERTLLDSISQQFVAHPPYPYAFFGMRCAAACYHLLSYTSIAPEFGDRKMVRRFFYPRKLRKYLIRRAKKTHWKITVSEGRESRKWDHD